MRKLFTSILFAYLFTLGMPLVFAVTVDPIECPFDSYEYSAYPGTYESEADAKANESEFDDAEQQKYGDFQTELDTALEESYANGTCGEPNAITGYLEKGDCTADGYVVTEINEVLAPDVSLTDETGNRVMTVYGGNCCLAYTVSGTVATCLDVRTLYTGGSNMTVQEAFKACDEKLSDCQRKQWVIGDSGINLVQVVVKQIFTWGALTVGSIAVLTIVLQGVKISVSGVSGDITESKNKILQAIAGIVLLFASGLILYTINPQFFS